MSKLGNKNLLKSSLLPSFRKSRQKKQEKQKEKAKQRKRETGVPALKTGPASHLPGCGHGSAGGTEGRCSPLPPWRGSPHRPSTNAPWAASTCKALSSREKWWETPQPPRSDLPMSELAATRTLPPPSIKVLMVSTLIFPPKSERSTRLRTQKVPLTASLTSGWGG